MKDFFDVSILRSTPIALFLYVFAFVVEKLVKESLVLLSLAALLGYGLIGGVRNLSTVDGIKAVFKSALRKLALNVVLGVPLLGRVLLLTLLTDRTTILAEGVRDECESLKKEGRSDKVCMVIHTCELNEWLRVCIFEFLIPFSLLRHP